MTPTKQEILQAFWVTQTLNPQLMLTNEFGRKFVVELKKIIKDRK